MRRAWIRGLVFVAILGTGFAVGSAVRAQEKDEPSLLELAKEANQAAKQSYENARLAFQKGAGDLEQVVVWSERMTEWSELAREATGPEAATSHYQRMTVLELDVKKLVSMGAIPEGQLSTIKFHRIKAQLLARSAR